MSCDSTELREPPLGVLTHQADRAAKSAKIEEGKPALQYKRSIPVLCVGCLQTSFAGANNNRTNLLRNLLLLCLKGTWWLSCLWFLKDEKQSFSRLNSHRLWVALFKWCALMEAYGHLKTSLLLPVFLFYKKTEILAENVVLCIWGAFGFLTFPAIRRCAMNILS